MTETLNKLCACLCFIGAVAFVAPACGGGGGEKGGSSCGDGEKLASVGGEQGCYKECDNGVCAAGASCTQGLCIPDDGGNNGGSNNGGTNNGGTNNGGTNNGGTNNGGTNNGGTNNGGTNNGGTNNGGTDPQIQADCAKVADLIYGSCWSSCTVDAETSAQLTQAVMEVTAQCVTDASADATYRQQIADDAATATCDDTKLFRCGVLGFAQECGCTLPTNVGAACTMDTDCQGGDFVGFCNTDAPGGGYCLAGPCPSSNQVPNGFTYEADTICGAGNLCQIFIDEQMQDQGVCIAGCANCSRAGYACQLIDIREGETMGTYEPVQGCFPACAANSDCSSDNSVRCNTTSGSCEIQCDGTPDPNGGPSLRDLCIASGGTCVLDGASNLEYCSF